MRSRTEAYKSGQPTPKRSAGGFAGGLVAFQAPDRSGSSRAQHFGGLYLPGVGRAINLSRLKYMTNGALSSWMVLDSEMEIRRGRRDTDGVQGPHIAIASQCMYTPSV